MSSIGTETPKSERQDPPTLGEGSSASSDAEKGTPNSSRQMDLVAGDDSGAKPTDMAESAGQTQDTKDDSAMDLTVDDNAELAEEEETAESQRKRTKRDKESVKKDRSLAELLLLLDEYRPVIPDIVTDHYLSRSGFECDDVRVKRLLALAAQKFVSDIAVDALQYCKIRGQGPQPKDRKGAIKDKRTILTMEDLSLALADHGINVKKPEYYL